jgi:hypothetical protein
MICQLPKPFDHALSALRITKGSRDFTIRIAFGDRFALIVVFLPLDKR